MQMFTLVELKEMKLGKGDIFIKKIDMTEYRVYDFALPQPWLDMVADFAKTNNPKIKYRDILSTTVWAYPENSVFGMPVTCCKEVNELIESCMKEG